MFHTQDYGDEYPTEIRGYASDEIDDRPVWSPDEQASYDSPL